VVLAIHPRKRAEVELKTAGGKQCPGIAKGGRLQGVWSGLSEVWVEVAFALGCFGKDNLIRLQDYYSMQVLDRLYGAMKWWHEVMSRGNSISASCIACFLSIALSANNRRNNM
jgi:hypothetical protein